MKKLLTTPSQTIGPFFAYSLTAEQYGYDYNSIVNGCLINDDTEGDRICIQGNIFDGEGATIPDALIEIWQANRKGEYRTIPIDQKNDGFTGIGRVGTGVNANHTFTFTTIKPGSISKEDAPHINIILFMRGSLHQLYTRLYFSDEFNETDPLLSSIDVTRRHTLIAQRQEINGVVHYQFNIYMQGNKETVFFDLRQL